MSAFSMRKRPRSRVRRAWRARDGEAAVRVRGVRTHARHCSQVATLRLAVSRRCTPRLPRNHRHSHERGRGVWSGSKPGIGTPQATPEEVPNGNTKQRFGPRAAVLGGGRDELVESRPRRPPARAGTRVTEVHDLGSSSVSTCRLRRLPAALPRRRRAYELFGRVTRRLGHPDAELAGVEEAVREQDSRPSRVRGAWHQSAAVLRDQRGGLRDRAAQWEGETLVKPLYGNRSSGIEICDSLARRSSEPSAARGLLVQQMIWPARCWRIVVGRESGVVDPYWREPPRPGDRMLSISTGSRIMRERLLGAARRGRDAHARGGRRRHPRRGHPRDRGGIYALEINHNFDAHGGDTPAAEAFCVEIEHKRALAVV